MIQWLWTAVKFTGLSLALLVLALMLLRTVAYALGFLFGLAYVLLTGRKDPWRLFERKE